MSGFLLLVTGRALLMSPKRRNGSRDSLVKIGWVVYLLLFPCIFSLGVINCSFSLVCCVTNLVQGFIIDENILALSHTKDLEKNLNIFCLAVSIKGNVKNQI